MSREITSWDDVCLTCIHGRREKVDYHDCPECARLTEMEFGPDEDTRIYLKRHRKVTKICDGDDE